MTARYLTTANLYYTQLALQNDNVSSAILQNCKESPAEKGYNSGPWFA